MLSLQLRVHSWPWLWLVIGPTIFVKFKPFAIIVAITQNKCFSLEFHSLFELIIFRVTRGEGGDIEMIRPLCQFTSDLGIRCGVRTP